MPKEIVTKKQNNIGLKVEKLLRDLEDSTVKSHKIEKSFNKAIEYGDKSEVMYKEKKFEKAAFYLESAVAEYVSIGMIDERLKPKIETIVKSESFLIAQYKTKSVLEAISKLDVNFGSVAIGGLIEYLKSDDGVPIKFAEIIGFANTGIHFLRYAKISPNELTGEMQHAFSQAAYISKALGFYYISQNSGSTQTINNAITFAFYATAKSGKHKYDMQEIVNKFSEHFDEQISELQYQKRNFENTTKNHILELSKELNPGESSVGTV